MKSNEQRLINMLFAIAISTKTNAEWYEKTEISDIAQHVRKELASIGFYTNPVGSMWGLLVNKDRYDETIKP